MPLSVPPELKKVTPFIRRAEELDKDKSNAESRLVAYYCRQYAVSVGIPGATSPEGKKALGTILNDLEKEKTVMAQFNRDESQYLCRQFADKIFEKADAEDRAGAAGKGTARTFYAAASFLEMLGQFYDDDDMPPEREEEKKKTVYAKWKATEILKAIKEGREPTPGGYGEGDGAMMGDEAEAPAAPTGTPDVFVPPPAADVFVPQPPPGPPPAASSPMGPPPTVLPDDDEGTEVSLGPPPTSYPPAATRRSPAASPIMEHFVPDPVPPPAPSPSSNSKGGIFGFGGKKKPTPKPGGKASKQQLSDATELTKFALAALDSKDPKLAISRLEDAINALR
eukprot:CAMPEP_0194028640 /NCGR_PEP_ID=MMETSP0009_2-20130614/2559_1 /TAXON_ID=210454 /ORGANISM="Grammatophora oceanica, Strain CCMP 410" /LENGTH=337 /DNA_ID=CAMNT_0038668085 /DNA_START=113 /DNA_END=1129 /DNA_ORIENTATION=+